MQGQELIKQVAELLADNYYCPKGVMCSEQGDCLSCWLQFLENNVEYFVDE